MITDRPIPYLPVDSPIPFTPRGTMAKAKKQTFDATEAADRFRLLKHEQEVIEKQLNELRANILAHVGPIDVNSKAELIGTDCTLKIRCTPLTTVSWKSIAEALDPPARLIEKHTKRKDQVYFSLELR